MSDTTALGGATPPVETPPTETPPTETPPTGEPSFKGTFYEGLEQNLYEDPSMKVFYKEDGAIDGLKLAKSYVNAQKMIGKKGVMVPDENSTEDDWKEFYAKVNGVVELDDYQIKREEDAKISEDFFKDFRSRVHELGVHPKQAQGLLDWYNQQVVDVEKNVIESQAAEQEKATTVLKQEWGESFENKVGYAKTAVDHFGGQDLKDYLNETGLGDNPTIIKVFAKIGESLNEDQFNPTALPKAGINPGEAREELDKIMGDMSHPYWNAQHGSHSTAVDRVKRLNAALHPETA